ncbi:MAG: type IV pilin protein [Gammaproteobacteria bacterium]|uniref:type IV pilin protein n=1 Tax=Oceanibaculum nanhaiense TaxID=1909734 RepID=UPI0032EFB779
MKTARRSMAGFTLLELMIVVIIVSIVTAVALPSYRGYAMRTSRAAAISDLQELTLFLERAFTAQGRYDDPASAGNLAAPLPFDTSPQGDANPRYNLALQTLAAASYTLQATPIGGQVADDECGVLRIDQAGTRCILAGSVCSTSASASERAQVEACW